ncbi:site-specific integrase [Streptomyces sp. NPDC059837]|uniref:site-specific integrase n=1 Tax=Streptomyces sp. NPDC059837 TaxID=3346968 RepID=UPI003653BB5D
MRAYAYTVLMLLNFLTARGLDLRLATENDVLEFRRWPREDAEETVGEATWDRDAAAIGGLYDYLAQVGYVSGRPWRATGRGESLGSGVSRDARVRHVEFAGADDGDADPGVVDPAAARARPGRRPPARGDGRRPGGLRKVRTAAVGLRTQGRDGTAGQLPAAGAVGDRGDSAAHAAAPGARPVRGPTDRRGRHPGPRGPGRRHGHPGDQGHEARLAANHRAGDGRRPGPAGAVHRPGWPDAHRLGLGPHPLAGVEADESVERAPGGPGTARRCWVLHDTRHTFALRLLPDPRGSR